MQIIQLGRRLLRSLFWFSAATCVAQNFQEFTTPGFTPYAITNGPDGALWFTGTSGTIGRMTTAGGFSQFPLPAGGFSQAIVSAPDGGLWTQVGTNQMARISTSGQVVDNSINDGALVWSMTIGPDGAIWLTNGGIGRLGTSGNFVQLSTGVYSTYGITTGSDGNLWFTAINTTTSFGVIGRMTPGGVVSAFPLSGGFVVKAGTIAKGADGAVWFAAETTVGTSQTSIGRISPTGAITMFGLPVSSNYSFPSPSIAAGTDGALWFTGNGAVGRITTSGAVSVYPFNGSGFQITAGSDGAMWLTDPSDRTLWRVTANAPPPPPPTISLITPSTIAVNSPATGVRILGNGLAPDPASPCFSAPLVVTWNLTTVLTVAQASSMEIDLTLPAELLTVPGNYSITVAVNQTNAGVCQVLTATAPVHVISASSGVLGVTSASLSYAAAAGSVPSAQTVGVTSTLGTLNYGVTVQYTSTAPGSWVGISSVSGSATPDNPGSLTISVTNAALTFSPGKYTAAVNVTSGSQVLTITLTLTIGAVLNVQSVLVFGAVAGSPAPAGAQDAQNLLVGAVGPSIPFTYTITPQTTSGGPSACAGSNVAPATKQSPGWLLINGSPNFGSGMTGQNVVVSVYPLGLPPGTYSDSITFFAGGSSATTQVYLVVESPQFAFTFSYTIGGAAPGPASTVALTSSCTQLSNLTLGYSSDQNWLTAVLNTVGGEFFINLTATPYGLAPGVYYGAITVTDLSGEVWVFVASLTVQSPAATGIQLTVSPNPAVTGQAVTLIATVQPLAASGSVVFYDGGGFIGTAKLSGGASTISLSFSTGNHLLTAVYSGNGAYPPVTSQAVTLQVSGAQLSTTTSFSVSPALQTFGNPVTLTATVTPPTATGVVTFLDGVVSVGIAPVSGGVASLSISTLGVGGHILTAAYGGDSADAGSNSTPVSVTITNPNAPAILAGGIVNAASFAGPVAPGSLVAIFTSQLMTQAAIFTTASLQNLLSGVSVTFNNIPAPMVQVVPDGAFPFVSVQVPFGVQPGSASVVITVNNISSAPVTTQIVASEPGIFTLNAQGTGQAIFVNLADGSIAAASGSGGGAHPIPRGQTAFFYVTGLGVMTPSVVDGSGVCPAADGLCHANAMPQVFVGGVQAIVSFAGQAPGFPGVGQINIAIPQTAPTGSSVSLTVVSADGTVNSNSATIAVQ